jgi:hypothetical protein
VESRNAEYGHNRIPDVLLDGAAVPLEHGPHLPEEAHHQLAHGFGIEPISELS